MRWGFSDYSDYSEYSDYSDYSDYSESLIANRSSNNPTLCKTNRI